MEINGFDVMQIGFGMGRERVINLSQKWWLSKKDHTLIDLGL